jgi:hypothetical protein
MMMSLQAIASGDSGNSPIQFSDGPRTQESLEKRLANWGRVSVGKGNSVLQEFWLLGRYHGQHYWSEGDRGSSSDWENRRYRMGAQATLYEKWTLHAQMVSGSDFEPFYNGFTELWSQWRFSEQVALTIGQQKHRFTHDRNVSSRYINTLERGQLLNMFGADYTPAVTLQGTIGKLSYYSGIFSNATGRNMWDAFTELDSGYSLLANSYYDVNRYLATDSAFVGMSYVFSDANAKATNLNVFQQGISNVLVLTKGPGSLIVESVLGLDSERGDAYGINVQMGYFLTDRLQIATRYQIATSDQSDGLLAQLRYERPTGIERGEQYHAEYVGLNYHFAGHRLKWMNGVEYSELDRDSVWTFSTAIRLFWGPHSGGPFPMAQLLPGRFE